MEYGDGGIGETIAIPPVPCRKGRHDTYAIGATAADRPGTPEGNGNVSNSAIIRIDGTPLCVHTRWNGSFDDVAAFAAYARLRNFGSPDIDPSGITSLIQVMANCAGGGYGLEVMPYDDAGGIETDNGTFVLEGWEVVDIQGRRGSEHASREDLVGRLLSIDACQPVSMMLGADFIRDLASRDATFLGELAVGDVIWDRGEGAAPVRATIVGFGDSGYPYVRVDADPSSPNGVPKVPEHYAREHFGRFLGNATWFARIPELSHPQATAYEFRGRPAEENMPGQTGLTAQATEAMEVVYDDPTIFPDGGEETIALQPVAGDAVDGFDDFDEPDDIGIVAPVNEDATAMIGDLAGVDIADLLADDGDADEQAEGFETPQGGETVTEEPAQPTSDSLADLLDFDDADDFGEDGEAAEDTVATDGGSFADPFADAPVAGQADGGDDLMGWGDDSTRDEQDDPFASLGMDASDLLGEGDGDSAEAAGWEDGQEAPEEPMHEPVAVPDDASDGQATVMFDVTEQTERMPEAIGSEDLDEPDIVFGTFDDDEVIPQDGDAGAGSGGEEPDELSDTGLFKFVAEDLLSVDDEPATAYEEPQEVAYEEVRETAYEDAQEAVQDVPQDGALLDFSDFGEVVEEDISDIVGEEGVVMTNSSEDTDGFTIVQPLPQDEEAFDAIATPVQEGDETGRSVVIPLQPHQIAPDLSSIEMAKNPLPYPDVMDAAYEPYEKPTKRPGRAQKRPKKRRR